MLGQVLSRVTYTEHRDTLFQSGEAHSDIHAVFPSPNEREIVETYCNYIECTQQPPDPRVPGSQVRLGAFVCLSMPMWCLNLLPTVCVCAAFVQLRKHVHPVVVVPTGIGGMPRQAQKTVCAADLANSFCSWDWCVRDVHLFFQFVAGLCLCRTTAANVLMTCR